MLEGGSVQVVEDHFLQLLLYLLRLSQNDAPFPLNCRFLKLGVLENILKNVDTLGDVLVQGLGEVDGVLALSVVLVTERTPGVDIGRTDV